MISRAPETGALPIADGLEAAKEWARQRDAERQVEEEALKQQRAAHEAELARLQQLLAAAMQAPLTTSQAVDNLLIACEQRGAAGTHGPARAAVWRAHAASLADMPPLEPITTDSPLVLAIRSKSDVISNKHPSSKLVITKPEQKIVGVAPAMRKSHGESWTPFDADPEDMYRQKLSNQTSRMTSQGNQNMFKVCAILRLTSSPASCFHS